MARTLAQLQNELNQRVDDIIETDVATFWLQTSFQECLDYHPWSFLEASATGSLGATSAAQTWSSVFSVSNFNRLDRFMVSNVEFSPIKWGEKDISGQYQVIAVSPDNTGFVTPGAESGTAYVKYLKSLSNPNSSNTLTAPATGESGVPANIVTTFEEAVISGAAKRFFEQALRPSMAGYWAAQRDYYLDTLTDNDNNSMESHVPSLGVRRYNMSGRKAF